MPERQISYAQALREGLDQAMAQDPRVIVHEQTSARILNPAHIPEPVDLIVCDASFISLAKVLAVPLGFAHSGAGALVLVKPQFEVGREHVGDGVVRDPQLRGSSVETVVRCAVGLGLTLRGVVASPLPGPSGNVEYFVWLERGGAHAGVVDPGATIERAVREGPS
jgi:23S rRNA (cytidine1920-2'-O)/16S rRNA (cytidine1409-2'-O)-methyltransferase